MLGLDDVPPYDEPAETEPTFEGNARIKALAGGRGDRAAVAGRRQRAVRRRAQRDARRAVGAVGRVRRPGRRRANNELLLAQLADVPDERRGARFRCAVALRRRRGGRGAGGDGEMRGRVIRELRGTGGFGYDVLFVRGRARRADPRSCRRTEKDAISHRGQGAARDRAARGAAGSSGLSTMSRAVGAR